MKPLLDRVPRSRAAVIGASIVAVLLIAMVASPHRVPLGIVLEGAVYGSVTGMLALGLVLTYRSDRIVNFSYGAMGGVGGSVAVLLYLGRHWNYLLCVVLGLAAGALVGGGTQILVIRRFARASRLVLTVATIGLAQVLGGVQLLLPRWLHGPPIVGGFDTPLSGPHINVGPVLFTGDAMLVVVVVPVVIGALALFLLRTNAGIAIRAIADNRDRATLLGLPLRRLATILWVVVGILAALTTILSAPTQGLTIDAGAGPTLLLPPLAAAVIAGMESLPVAFCAGVGLGVLDALVRWNVSKQSVTSVAFLVVILFALLLKRGSSKRDNSEETALSTQVIAPIPRAVSRLPEVTAARVIGVLALAALSIVLPQVVAISTVRLLSIGVIYAIVAVSLVVLTGWAGEVSLGQYAIVGLGAVLVGDLINHLNLDLFVCLVAAGVGGALLAVAVGLPALRIRGLFLAVTTLALAVAVNGFFLNPTNFPSLIPSAIDRPVLWKRFDLTDERTLYYVCLGVLVATIVAVVGVRSARAGRAMLATRDNPRAAAAMAVPTTQVKLMCFVVSGAVAGVAGGLHAVVLQSIGFGTYQPSESLLVFSMVVIGGLGSISGALCGVAAIELAVHLMPQYQLLITGTGLLLVLLVLPGGIGAALVALRDRVLRLVAARRGLDLTPAADGATGAPVEPVIAAPDTLGLVDDEPLFVCSGVQAKYGAMQVLFGVDLEVHDGEIVALLGTNGAGKSTLLKAAAGLLDPAGGRVRFDGRDITQMSPGRKARSGLAMMPAKSVFPTLTVAENLAVAGWMLRDSPDDERTARTEVLALFPVLEERSGQLAGDLSGGEQQMLSLAMALMTRPRLLLIDELSLGLAPTIVARLLGVVRNLAAAGVTIIIVEQSVNVALELAERAVFLEKGQVRFSGRTRDLLGRPDVLRSVFIAGAASIDQPPTTRSGKGKARAKVTEVARAALTERTVLECQEIVKDFGGIRALDHVNFALRKGEILGLIGHNGAGKTTLFDVINGFLTPDRGRVLLGGARIDQLSAAERSFLGMGRSFQEARLFPSLTVEETIAVALERHVASRDIVAAALRLPASTLSEFEIAERVDELVEQLGLGKYAESPVARLSTGTRRIVELACALAHDPAVLLLDEPSGGVAQKETEALGPLLRQVREETGCAMLVIEHDMPLLSGLCDRLIALELGGIIAEGAPAVVLEHPRVVESYLGTDIAATERSGPPRQRKAARTLAAT